MSKDKSFLFAHAWRILAPDLPALTPEYNFDKVLGRKHRFDFAHVSSRIGVEVDGGQFAPGGGRHATDADREKLNIAASLRWLVFRFSPKQLETDPQSCVDMVRMAIKDGE